ncbi:bifunctional methylenetetrahydrofolate dehydrogenase/methenyltetrahydrofolate cyclohydrolase [Rhodoblastus sphagnicola]|uniref:Bifunctional protein FolD n=1 Tax=Rhodoblastus sphagnicola TaxID=333368 RepID=A0A2S6MXY5_9HYPH|nr:bifunctional methylenetetrahydrofolate dehydrogenase/methenyltetrahydrofolate cyclohydrolase FolD [Rhodoblastus sphagnicola]MBB4198081.1 methylenetetrahydrofolate dehydrogenase (NADP+)/methenyltetrahydrofolate cyclohydrolase [Rhodoblastus sphagnicola]PPQ27222.1 bifunctional methylenetetrahydrofolate dehydrogenase/methenyltetrahydrofolate cyclohydrolase [Rhodoblastus sphagnicola]
MSEIVKTSGKKALLIDGKAAQAEVLARVAAEAALLKQKPGLAVVLVGEDPASQVYVKSKGKAASACGFLSVQHDLPVTTTQAELIALVQSLNVDPAIHGILVQLPLPKGIDASKVLETIAPEKDVDGFHPVNVGLLATGLTDRALVPCTPAGAMLLIEEAAKALGRDISGAEAVIVGRSNIVGKPMAQLLLARNATVTVAHSRTRDLPAVARRADILVAAVGRPEMIRGDWIKPGALVIDVGINRIPGEGFRPDGQPKTRLVGDVALQEALEVAGAITPVPGGVGPMTIALLMSNTLRAAKLAAL